MAQLRRPRDVGGGTGDPFGHLGDRTLEPVEWAQHPPGERAGDDRSDHEHNKTAGRHPQPGSRDIACRHRGVDRKDDGADEITVLAYSRRGHERVPLPRHDRSPLRRGRVDEGVSRGRCNAGLRDIERT